MFQTDNQMSDRVTPMHNERMLSTIGSVQFLLTTTNMDETVTFQEMGGEELRDLTCAFYGPL